MRLPHENTAQRPGHSQGHLSLRDFTETASSSMLRWSQKRPISLGKHPAAAAWLEGGRNSLLKSAQEATLTSVATSASQGQSNWAGAACRKHRIVTFPPEHWLGCAGASPRFGDFPPAPNLRFAVFRLPAPRRNPPHRSSLQRCNQAPKRFASRSPRPPTPPRPSILN
jgi:hypothetical protein